MAGRCPRSAPTATWSCRTRGNFRPERPFIETMPMLRRQLPWLIAALMLLSLPAAAAAAPWIGGRGHQLLDQSGQTVRLLGINRSGAEYACVEEGKIFDGPTDWASIKAMKSWKINAVRLPLNESCWLGI